MGGIASEKDIFNPLNDSAHQSIDIKKQRTEVTKKSRESNTSPDPHSFRESLGLLHI